MGRTNLRTEYYCYYYGYLRRSAPFFTSSWGESRGWTAIPGSIHGLFVWSRGAATAAFFLAWNNHL